jgi:hypothetical protein
MHPSVANDLATHNNVYNDYMFLSQNILQLSNSNLYS